MQLIQVCLLALVSGYAIAQDIDNDDVPFQCRSVCASVVSLTQTCDRQNGSSFINCVCSSTNAATLVPACEACVANFDRDDGSDNDVNDLVRSCSFTRVAYVSTSAGTSSTVSSSSAQSVTPISGTRTTVISASATGTASQLPTATNTGIRSSTTTSAGVTPLSSVVSSVISSARTETTSTVSGNAGYANGVKVKGVVAGLMVAALGLA